MKANDIKNIYVSYRDNDELERYRRDLVSTQALDEDYELECIIQNDIGNIYNEVGYQDGMYENFPFTRVRRDENGVRVYAFTSTGGIAIVYKDKQFHTITLGEDDGYFFPRSRCIHETMWGVKSNFIWAMSEALSAFNALKLD